MNRRVGSARFRNRASLLAAITWVHQIGEPVQNSMQVVAALIILHRLIPVWTANALESIVSNGDLRAGDGGSQGNHEPQRMRPPTALFEPGQDETSLRRQFQHSPADPCVVIGAEEAICAADAQIDFKIGTDPAAQSFLRGQPPPDGARRSLDLNRPNDPWNTGPPNTLPPGNSLPYGNSLAASTRFAGDWPDLVRVRVTEALVERAAGLAWEHGVRGDDAIQLASAVELARNRSARRSCWRRSTSRCGKRRRRPISSPTAPTPPEPEIQRDILYVNTAERRGTHRSGHAGN